MISAKIITDSKNQFGNRLTTFVLVLPRITLAELNTHKMISKNSASSRAIPFEKMLQRVQEDPFIPIKWMKDHKGMQGTEFFGEQNDPGYVGTDYLTKKWLQARDEAVNYAEELSHEGLTKQIVNRLIEPFMWHTVIATASEFENFFALRAHPAAEIHIAKLAELMLEEYNISTPKNLKPGQWHAPFGDSFDEDRIKKLVIDTDGMCVHFDEVQWQKIISEYKVKISSARCARISYNNFEGKDDYAADVKLHDTLSSAGHMSPFEHCAKSMSEEEYNNSGILITNNEGKTELQKGWSGNIRGFVQYRKMLLGENKADSRVIKK